MPQATLELIKKTKDYGVTAILIVVLYMMNERLVKVESKMTECFEDRVEEFKQRRIVPIGNNTFKLSPELVAVLPNRLKIK